MGEKTHDCTVLVVDDENIVRQAVGALLNALGYGVELACSAAEALTVLDRRPIDIVLTDVTMPCMSGIELGAKLARLRPSLPVIYMSGQFHESALPASAGRCPTRFLPKPFRLAALKKTVGEAAADVGG